ncbi:MAG: PE domain-containing protein, partial [Mycobacterium sp.]
MSYVITEPDVVKGAAQDLAGIRASLADAAATVSGPTTGIVAAGQDEVSIAIASLFGNAGRQFQVLNAQAQAFHAEFESLLGAGAAAYVSAEAANVAQIAGGGQVAAAALPAQAEQTFNLLSGILDVEIGPGGILVTIDAPGINLPALNIPPINLSAFDLPKITIPSISIPPFATPPINVSGFNLPQITTPPISVPPITFPAVTIPNFSLPQIQVPAISFPSIQVPGIGLPTISVPRIGFPGIQFPDLNVAVPGNMEPIITLTNGPLSLTTINLDSFNIVASLGLNTPGYITGFTIPSIGLGPFTIPPIGLGAFTIPPIGLGPFTIPPIGLSGFTIPPITIPPIGLSGFT